MSSATLSQTNQDGLDDLLAAIEANDDRLGIFIAVCDDTGLREEIIQQYERELAPAFRHYRLALQRDEPSIKALISGQVAEDEYLQQGGLAVLTITGAEYLSAMRRGQEEKSAQEEFLGYLQWTREGLRKFPFAIVIWVTQQLLETISRKAPDFWSWRRDVIRFTSRRSITVSTKSLMLGLEDSLALPEEIGETLTLFDVEALIEDTAEKDPQSPLLASLYSQAGKLYARKLEDNTIVDYAAASKRAISHLQKALQLLPSANSLSETATSLSWLAWLKKRQGDVREAITLYQDSLAIREQIGDVQGKARTLHELAMLKANQGDVKGATTLCQESLAINEQTGDVQGKASTLHQLAGLKADQGDVEGAIALYQESLAITEQIDDVKAKAATLHQLAMLNATQGDVKGAITLYQDSLAIKEQIGNVQGKAVTLHNLGEIKANQGDVEGAIALYQDSLAINEQIGYVQGKAATLHQLAGLKVNQGDVEGAIALYQDSLAITKKVGNVQGTAATLTMMGQLLADEKGDTATAIIYLQESLAILQRIGSPDARTVQDILDRISGQS